jgi:predicted helicase
VSTIGARSGFSAYVTRDLPDVHLWVDDTPCFPRYVYDIDTKSTDSPRDLFGGSEPYTGKRHHNVTDEALDLYRALDPSIKKDDLFFYVYGIFHSPGYRTLFASDLKKSLPRIPQVATADDFWSFSRAGGELATLHTEYEKVEVWPDLQVTTASSFEPTAPDAYRVKKMRHPKVDGNVDRSRIIYNDLITVENIPESAYDYELGSRSAIGWVMESWRIRTDRASGIINDPNDWAREHADPRYILDRVNQNDGHCCVLANPRSLTERHAALSEWDWRSGDWRFLKSGSTNASAESGLRGEINSSPRRPLGR